MIIHRFVYVLDQPLADMLLDLSDILQVSVVLDLFSLFIFIFIVIPVVRCSHTTVKVSF